MVVKYRGENSEDVYTEDELGFKGTVPDSITMGHPETGVTEKFVRVEVTEDEVETSDSDGSDVEEVLEMNPDAEEFFEEAEEDGDLPDPEELIDEGEEISGEEYIRSRLDDLSWPELQSVSSEFEDVSGTKEEIINALAEEDIGEVDTAIGPIEDE